MAALQFQIHADVDKENVPSHIHKGNLQGMSHCLYSVNTECSNNLKIIVHILLLILNCHFVSTNKFYSKINKQNYCLICRI